MENTKPKSKAKLTDVLRAFWAGIKYHKVAFYYVIVGTILGNVLELLVPLQYKRFFDLISASTNKSLLIATLLHIIFIILLLNILRWMFFRSTNLTVNYFESKVMARLQNNSFDYLVDHSYSFFSNNFSGALVQRAGRFVRSFEKLFDTFIYNFIPLLVTLVVVLVVTSKQQPLLAAILLIWTAIVVLVSFLFSMWKLKYDIASAAADSKLTGYLADVITNQNTVASFAASEYESKSFMEVSFARARAHLLTWNLGELMNASQASLIVAIEFILFYYALKFWQTGTITIGTFVLIQVYVLNLSQKIWNLGNLIRNIYEGVADAKEMVDILKLPHEVADVPNAKPLAVPNGEIEFKNVSFGFNDSRKVIENINLSVRSGEKVGLIGPSGAGKSTVVKLLLRMYNLADGVISVDGQDIQNIQQESLRRNISLVPQDPVLFHRSLMDNIRYGKQNATDAEVMEAARLAHCDEFIETLPLKYNTFVGERGIKLSGGERQRVAIARAILKNAPILILDEATSSLDSHSESLIQDALDKLMKGKTSIVIAHRLSTIRKMDRIIVLEKGKIIEEGTHDDLTSRKESLYKNLWSLQAGGFILDEETE